MQGMFIMLNAIILNEAELQALIDKTARTTAEHTAALTLEALKSSEKRHDDDFLTRDEVCKLLHISKVTLNARMRSGDIPYRKIGRRVLFSRPEIMASISAISGKAG